MNQKNNGLSFITLERESRSHFSKTILHVTLQRRKRRRGTKKLESFKPTTVTKCSYRIKREQEREVEKMIESHLTT